MVLLPFTTLGECSRTVKIVIISHKVIRLNEVDKIYVIKNGVIIETGSLGKLLQQKGTFYDMFITQKKDVT